jgi:hypothetical protein
MHSSKSMRWVEVVIAGAVLAVGVTACSSSSSGSDTGTDAGGTDGGGGSDSSSTVDGSAAVTACAAEATAICTLRSTCSMMFNIERNFPDIATCEARTQQTCVAALAANGAGQTPAGITACGAAYPDEACNDYFDGNPVAACVPPAGTLATGAACGASSQCTSTFCAVSQYQVCGTCQALPAVGATCQVTADCGRDLACAVATGATMGVCAAYGVSAASCLTGVAPCGAGLACVDDDVTTMTMGTCMAQGSTVGASCDATRKTAANCNADLGITCIPTAAGSGIGTCTNITLVTAGTACGDVGSAPITGFSDCEASGLCVKASATATTGTCATPAVDGASCNNDPTLGPPCLAPAKCVPSSATSTAGTCTVPDAATCM